MWPRLQGDALADARRGASTIELSGVCHDRSTDRKESARSGASTRGGGGGDGNSTMRATTDSLHDVQLDFVARELTIKLVYYGPALSGKTSNLQAMHRLSSDGARGRLMTLDTRDDRTLFFDLLPLAFKTGDLSLRIKLFTVPGQVIHSSTRRMVLQGADGVAFIADSQLNESDANRVAFLDLRQNLKDNGIDLRKMPLVIQFNKRDMPPETIRTDAEIEALAKQGREPVYKASAIKGEGVLETFLGLLTMTWARLDSEHDFSNKFKIRSETFTAGLAKQLGIKGDPQQLIDAAVGVDPRSSTRSTSGGGRS
jgi:signal recognition particle receptor subunit beta